MEKEKIFQEFISIIDDYVKEADKLESATMNTDIISDLRVNSARLVDIII
ncbi:MAG: acyl carrier protein, partial [Desulfobacterales bacterium]|nr:acyl carrier protein [Desulfobacterales bacterium]